MPFPALPNNYTPPALAPGEAFRQSFVESVDQFPSVFRKSIPTPWLEPIDIETAAGRVFNEEQPIHSFWRIKSIESLVAVASLLGYGGLKPWNGPVYLFALPDELIGEYGLAVEDAPGETRCQPLDELHVHVTIEREKTKSLFRAIQTRRCFNYCVDRHTMRQIGARFQDCGVCITALVRVRFALLDRTTSANIRFD